MTRKQRETPWQIAEREREKVNRMTRLAVIREHELQATAKRRRQEEADMRYKRHLKPWPEREVIK